MSTERPTIEVAVILRRERIVGAMSRWQEWRWVLDDVLPNEAGFGTAPRLLYDDAGAQRWLHPALRVELFKDDAEGYELNVSTPAPCWFVLWRMEEQASIAAQALARPIAVSLSYHDAGRWLDAQETVEQVAAPTDVVQWLRAFITEHYQPEVKRRRRPESFKSLADRFGNPVSITADKLSSGAAPGSGEHHG
ncbi:MAG: DUF3305 domain-containing protein [Betaproteobacteria bacterium]